MLDSSLASLLEFSRDQFFVRVKLFVSCFDVSLIAHFATYIACVASVSVGFRSKQLTREKKGGGGGLSPQFRAGKIPFLGLSLFPNSTETLATQATTYIFRLPPFTL